MWNGTITLGEKIALAMKGQLEAGRSAISASHPATSRIDAGAHSNLNAWQLQSNSKRHPRSSEESLCGLNPDDAQAHNNLGNVLAGRASLTEAITHYEKALKLNDG